MDEIQAAAQQLLLTLVILAVGQDQCLLVPDRGLRRRWNYHVVHWRLASTRRHIAHVLLRLGRRIRVSVHAEAFTEQQQVTYATNFFEAR